MLGYQFPSIFENAESRQATCQKAQLMILAARFNPVWPPELLPQFSRYVESLGYRQVWIAEDCFASSGHLSAITALASTDNISVAVGISPVLMRNPVLAAMEIAHISRQFPARFSAGFGVGVAAWMRSIGAMPSEPVSAVHEYVDAVKSLLAGNRVSTNGRYVKIVDAQLLHPPIIPPKVFIGARGQKALTRAIRTADGVVLGDFSGASMFHIFAG